MLTGIKTKNVPQSYSEYIYNGDCKEEQDTYDLEIWLDMNTELAIEEI